MTTTVCKCPTCGGDAVDRSEFYEAVVENGNEINLKIHDIEKAVRKYYLDLDNREHGVAAQNKAFHEIENALGMTWEQGKMTEFLDKHPRLKPFYT